MTGAERIGQNIQRARMALNLSQEECGYRAGMHRTVVGHLERGEQSPRAETIIRLAGALECTPGDLLAGVVWRPPPPQVFGSLGVEPAAADRSLP